MSDEKPTAPRRVGVPGELTRSQYMLVFAVPVIAVVALIIGVVVQGRAEARRDQNRADEAVERILAETLGQSGSGLLANDAAAAWMCEAARERGIGQRVNVQPFVDASREVAKRFVEQLC